MLNGLSESLASALLPLILTCQCGSPPASDRSGLDGRDPSSAPDNLSVFLNFDHPAPFLTPMGRGTLRNFYNSLPRPRSSEALFRASATQSQSSEAMGRKDANHRGLDFLNQLPFLPPRQEGKETCNAATGPDIVLRVYTSGLFHS